MKRTIMLTILYCCALFSAVAPTVALAQAAASEPKPDPAGIATGDKSSVVDAAGNPFIPSPATPDFQAQAAREPLAVKLADAVGHLRTATNFSWTLSTGYLVLFMQAGFALLTCGLVRKKNAAHLMMLNFAAYVFAFLAYYAVGYAFQFGAVAINAAPTNLGGIPTLINSCSAAASGASSAAKDFS